MPSPVLIVCDPSIRAELLDIVPSALLATTDFAPSSSEGRAFLAQPGLLIVAVADHALRAAVLAARRCDDPARWNVVVCEQRSPDASPDVSSGICSISELRDYVRRWSVQAEREITRAVGTTVVVAILSTVVVVLIAGVTLLHGITTWRLVAAFAVLGFGGVLVLAARAMGRAPSIPIECNPGVVFAPAAKEGALQVPVCNPAWLSEVGAFHRRASRLVRLGILAAGGPLLVMLCWISITQEPPSFPAVLVTFVLVNIIALPLLATRRARIDYAQKAFAAAHPVESGRCSRCNPSLRQPFALYLRAFGSEGTTLIDKARVSIIRHAEDACVRATPQHWPLVGIRNTLDARMNENVRWISAVGVDWKALVTRLANEAAVIIIFVDRLGPGLTWEMNLVSANEQLAKKTLLMLASSTTRALRRARGAHIRTVWHAVALRGAMADTYGCELALPESVLAKLEREPSSSRDELPAYP